MNSSDLKLIKVESQLADIAKKIPNYITPEMFGAKGNGVNDDSSSIQQAINYAESNGVTIRFGSNVYLCTSVIELSDFITLEGNYVNDEYGKGTIIQNPTTDIFKVKYNSKYSLYRNMGVKISGICFIGNKASRFINADVSSNLYWSQIRGCGFVSFNEVFNNIKLTGCWLKDIFINGVISVGKIGGADNNCSNWFVSVDETSAVRADVLLNLENMEMSRFNTLFLTGGVTVGNGAKQILLLNMSKRNVFNKMYIDFCDQNGLVIKNHSTNNVFSMCSFRGNGRDNNAVYDSILLQTNSDYNIFSNNLFLSSTLADEMNINARFFDIQDGVARTIIDKNTYQIDREVLRNLGVDTSVNEVKISDINTHLDIEIIGVYATDFSTYITLIPANSTKVVNIGNTPGLETQQVLYKAFVTSQGAKLPDGIQISKCRYDGTNIKITFKNVTSTAISLNAVTYFKIYTLF